MSRWTVLLCLAVAPAAWAGSSHQISINVEYATGVFVDAAPVDLTLHHPGIGEDTSAVSASGWTSVGYSTIGDKALVIEADSDPRQSGFRLEAVASGTSCGVANSVDVGVFPQPLIDLDGDWCSETIDVQYRATLEPGAQPDDAWFATLTYTLF